MGSLICESVHSSWSNDQNWWIREGPPPRKVICKESKVLIKASVWRAGGKALRYSRSWTTATTPTRPATSAGLGRMLLDDLVRNGARQMLAAALQAEVTDSPPEDYVQGAPPSPGMPVRSTKTATAWSCVDTTPNVSRDLGGVVAVKAPQVNDKRTEPETDEHKRFSSAILPECARKSELVSEVLALLYLHACFRPGQLRAPVVDGIYLKVWLEQEKPSLLVMCGIRADGREELVTLTGWYHESSEPWADLSWDSRRRGTRVPPLDVEGHAPGHLVCDERHLQRRRYRQGSVGDRGIHPGLQSEAPEGGREDRRRR